MKMEGKKILILSPHTDDETLGCGGFMNKLSKNNDISVVCFSYCDREDLKKEFINACLTIDEDIEIGILDFKVRYFDRQEVLDVLVKLKTKINPDVIICPSSFDIHQDHQVVYNESVRAFKDKTILGYCHHWNVIGISDLRLTVKLDEDDIRIKNLAMDKYESQYHREYFKDRVWIGNEEKFEVVLWKY